MVYDRWSLKNKRSQYKMVLMRMQEVEAILLRARGEAGNTLIGWWHHDAKPGIRKYKNNKNEIKGSTISLEYLFIYFMFWYFRFMSNSDKSLLLFCWFIYLFNYTCSRCWVHIQIFKSEDGTFSHDLLMAHILIAPKTEWQSVCHGGRKQQNKSCKIWTIC